MLRRLFRDLLDGLRAGFDVLWWGRAYPRTFPLRAHGGTIPAYRPRADEQLVLLSPGRRIVDPDEAEALGLTADAKRMRERGSLPPGTEDRFSPGFIDRINHGKRPE
jgi:hypothetical protein